MREEGERQGVCTHQNPAAKTIRNGGDAGTGENRTFKKIELFDDVKIDTRQADGKPTKITSGYALYENVVWKDGRMVARTTLDRVVGP